MTTTANLQENSANAYILPLITSIYTLSVNCTLNVKVEQKFTHDVQI